MADSSNTTATGVFDSDKQAANAIAALKHAGIREEEIGVTSRNWSQNLKDVRVDMQHQAESGAVHGALMGGALGASLGLVGATLIPGALPVIAGSALLTVLAGGFTGAAGGTFVGPFLAMGFSDSESKRHAKHIELGKTIVLVHSPGRQKEALSIMVANGAYDDSMANN
jgi:hypothetical protein